MLRPVTSGTKLEKDDIPAISEDNILSTFEQLHLNKQVFERGIINVFRG
jgi:hypothetical protein